MADDNASDSAYGQATPFTSNTEFGIISFIVRQMIAQMDTMKLVKVTKVTGGGGAIAAAGTVDVQLLVSQVDGQGNAFKHGVVSGIPWWRLSGGTSAIIVDPAVGDIGYVIVSDRDISSVKTAAAAGKDPQGAPGSFRKNSISDGVYVGSVLTKDAPTQYLAFTADGIKITDKSGNVIEMAAAGITITPAPGMPVTVNGQLVVTGILTAQANFQLGGSLKNAAGATYAGNITTSGDVTAAGKSLSLHTHSQGTDSHGDTEANTSAPL